MASSGVTQRPPAQSFLVPVRLTWDDAPPPDKLKRLSRGTDSMAQPIRYARDIFYDSAGLGPRASGKNRALSWPIRSLLFLPRPRALDHVAVMHNGQHNPDAEVHTSHRS